MSTTIQATGRRKTATAKVRLKPGTGEVLVNNRPLRDYFPEVLNQNCVLAPFVLTERQNAYDVVAKVQGGGTTGQKEALRHGISRALAVADPDCRDILKKNKFLRRDPRRVEPKRYGLYKARKAHPFVKR